MHAFIATLGSKPQVVTLALDELIKQGEPIEQVYILLTDPSLEPIHTAWLTVQDSLKEYPQIILFQEILKEGDAPLNDVATVSQIDVAFQQTYALIRRLKLQKATVHLSIAGGRKTMTSFVLSAANLLFEQSDKVWHLVSSVALMSSNAMHSTESEQCYLVEVPQFHHFMESPSTKIEEFLRLLTPSEKEVFDLLIQYGMSNDQIAYHLTKSTKTVANQLTGVYQKFEQAVLPNQRVDRSVMLAHLGRVSYKL